MVFVEIVVFQFLSVTKLIIVFSCLLFLREIIVLYNNYYFYFTELCINFTKQHYSINFLYSNYMIVLSCLHKVTNTGEVCTVRDLPRKWHCMLLASSPGLTQFFNSACNIEKLSKAWHGLGTRLVCYYSISKKSNISTHALRTSEEGLTSLY